MSKEYANVNSTTGTFAGWLSKANELYYDMSRIIVTVSNTATQANNSNESRTIGNADIQGSLSANNMVVWDTLSGGRNEEWANTDTLYIVSNTHIGSASVTVTDYQFVNFGDTTLHANVVIGNTSVASNTTINANTRFTSSSFIQFETDARFLDNDILNFGTDDDASFYHNGTNLYTDLDTGTWHVRNASDQIIHSIAQSGDLELTEYSATERSVHLVLNHYSASPANSDQTGSIFFRGYNANSEVIVYNRILGFSTDVTDGSEDGVLYIQAIVDGTTKNQVRVGPEVQLYYDGDLKLQTVSGGVNITGELQSDSLDVNGVWDITGIGNLHANTYWDDSSYAIFGAGNDLQIYHDGSHSYIKDNGTGNLKLLASQIDFLGGADGAETMATMVDNGAVTLYYDNAVKFVTQADGIEVTGDVDTDTLFTSGQANVASLMVRDLTNNRVLIAGTSGEVEDDGNLTFDGTTFKVGGLDASVFSVTTGGVGNFDGALTVDGLSSLDGGIDVNTAKFTVSTAGAIYSNSTLDIDGVTNLNSTLIVDGLVTADAGIDIDNINIDGTTINLSSGNLTVSAAGDIYVKPTGDDVYMQGVTSGEQLLFNLGTTVQSITASDALSLASTGDTTIDSSADIILDADGADIILKDNGTQYGAFTNSSGNLIVKSGSATALTFTGANLSTPGTVSVTDSTQSNTSTTGALTVTGGAGIAKNLNVGGDVDVSGDLVVDGTATFSGSGNLTVNNSIITTLSVIGDSDIGNSGSDTISINATVDTDIIPNADSTYSLGSNLVRWSNVYADTLYGTGTNLTALNASNISSGTISDARLPATISSDITGNAATVTNGVYTTGNQTIAGVKTFSSTITGSITGNAATVTNGVYTTGNQTIAGVKTFSSNTVHNGYLSFENGDHGITWNDGGGNFNIRVGHYFDSVSKYSDNDLGAIHFHFAHENSNPYLDILIGEDPTGKVAGDGVTFDQTLRMMSDGTFTWGGAIIWTGANDGPGSALYAGSANNSIYLNGQNASYYLNASNISSGTISDARLPATISSDITGNAATVTNGVYTTRTLTAGDGLSGGGDLSANRSFAVDSTVVRTTVNQTIGGTKTFSSSIVGSITGNAATVTNGVYTNSIQTITGTKTFSGGVNFDGTTTSSSSLLIDAGYLRLNDNVGLNFGTDSDASLFHDGTTLYTDLDVGNWYVRDASDRAIHQIIQNGDLEITGYSAAATAVNLYLNHYSASPAEWDQTGSILFRGYNANYEIINYNRIIGFSTDVTDGSENSSLNIQGIVNGTMRNQVIVATAVELYYDGDLKFQTVSGGVTITGTATATTFSGSGASLTTLNASNISSGTISDARLPATISSDITGNAATVTNGVYTTRTLTAGDGLSGGGDLSANRSFAVDSTVVRTTVNQTIGGIKTFSSTISGSITGNAATVTNGVYTTGNQTIGGIKTFSSTISGSITGNAATVTNGVYTTGNQTIAGTKTFSSTISGSIDGNAATVTNGVYTTGTQEIAGSKTFTGATYIKSSQPTLFLNVLNDDAQATIYQSNTVLRIRSRGGTSTYGDIYLDTWNGTTTDTVMMIDGSTGRVGIQKTNPSTELDVAGTITATALRVSGDIIATGDITAFGSISDIRLKENIEPITNALDKVSQIGGYTFAYKKNPDVRMTGVIAQEVEKVLPEVIYTTADINSGEENLAVRYENMIGLLVEAIKELKTEVEELKKGK